MKKEDLNIDNAFREKLEGFSTAPPAYVWNNIHGKLTTIRRKRQRMLTAWISAAAVIVLAFIAGWLLNDSPQSESTVVAQKEMQTKSVDEGTSEKTKKEEFAQTNENILSVSVDDKKNEDLITEKNTEDQAGKLMAENRNISQTVYSETDEREKTSFSMLKNISAVFKFGPNQKYLDKVHLKKTNTDLSALDKNLIAQNASIFENSEVNAEKWKVGIYASPGYSSHQASHRENYSKNMTYSGSEGNTNLGGGFSVQYKTNKKWSIESGVYYSKNGQNAERSFQLFAMNDGIDFAVAEEESSKSFFGNAVNVENGEMLMNSTAGIIAIKETPKGAEISSDFEALRDDYANTLISDGEFSQVFDFIEIPFYVRYHLIDKKVGVEIMGGVNAGLVVGNNAYIDNQFGVQNIGKTQEISPVNISGTLGLGLNYGLSKSLSVSLEPRVNYYLNSINTNPSVNFRPYRIGIFTGLNYEF